MNLIGHGFEHVAQKRPSRFSVRRRNELSHSELAGAIDANKQVELALPRLREQPIVGINGNWSILPEKSKDDDDFQETAERLRAA